MSKRILAAVLLLALLLCGCQAAEIPDRTVAVTTAPVRELTERILSGSEAAKGTAVRQLVTESVSCLHDYSLSVQQMKILEQCEVLIVSGLGLEQSMEDVLKTAPKTIDASAGIAAHAADHEEHEDHEAHDHGESDPHIWLAPENAVQMAENIAAGLGACYPQDADLFSRNAAELADELTELQKYGEQQLGSLRCRSLVTFHDGFAYFAEAFDLEIAAAMEVEAGSEPSARELEEIVDLVKEQQIPAIFVEENGSDSAAELVAAATGAKIYTLSMGMEDGALEAIRHNIDTIKEALG